jgi:hypothetical protein
MDLSSILFAFFLSLLSSSPIASQKSDSLIRIVESVIVKVFVDVSSAFLSAWTRTFTELFEVISLRHILTFFSLPIWYFSFGAIHLFSIVHLGGTFSFISLFLSCCSWFGFFFG